jgi:hypothetical protein
MNMNEAETRAEYIDPKLREDPEKYAITKVRNEKSLRSVADAVLRDIRISRSAIAVPTIQRYTAPIIIVATWPASGNIRRSKTNPATKRIVLMCRTLAFMSLANLVIP